MFFGGNKFFPAGSGYWGERSISKNRSVTERYVESFLLQGVFV